MSFKIVPVEQILGDICTRTIMLNIKHKVDLYVRFDPNY